MPNMFVLNFCKNNKCLFVISVVPFFTIKWQFENFPDYRFIKISSVKAKIIRAEIKHSTTEVTQNQGKGWLGQ